MLRDELEILDIVIRAELLITSINVSTERWHSPSGLKLCVLQPKV